MTSSKIIEVMARAAYEHEWSKIKGFTPWKKSPEQAYWVASMQAALTSLQASGMAVVPRAEIEEARARFAEIRLLLPDGRACELAGAGAWDLNHILTAPKDGKAERPPASAERASASEPHPGGVDERDVAADRDCAQG